MWLIGMTKGHRCMDMAGKHIHLGKEQGVLLISEPAGYSHLKYSSKEAATAVLDAIIEAIKAGSPYFELLPTLEKAEFKWEPRLQRVHLAELGNVVLDVSIYNVDKGVSMDVHVVR